MRYKFLLLIILFALPQNSTSLEPIERNYWYEIYSGKDKVGYSHLFRKTQNNLINLDETTFINIKVLGEEKKIKTTTKYLLEGFDIKTFQFNMESNSAELNLDGKFDGETLTILNSDNGSDYEYKIKKKFIIPSDIPNFLINRGLNKNKKYSLYIFDPLSLYMGVGLDGLNAEITVGSKETLLIKSERYSAYRVYIKYPGTDSLMWILENGTIVKETFEPDFVSFLSNKTRALSNKVKVIDISEKTSVKSNLLIKNPRKTQYLKLRLWGENLDPDKFNIYDGYSQLKENGYLVIKKADLNSINSDNLPFNNKDFDEFLEPSNLIQSDNNTFIDLGKKIIGEETDSLRASKKINQWVFKYLEKAPIVSIPSALEVLENKKGDCNEHAVLFAAITRAVGIPSKIALGLVYLNGRFYYHAWNEVYIGKWVSVDPTFGQIPADATHLKILEGDISRSSEILKVVGKINIDIIDAN